MQRILAIDDDPDNRLLLEVALRDLEGLDLTLLDAAEGAEETIRRRRPDVVLVDLMLPGRSGEELIRALQPLRRERPLLIVALSALDGPRWPGAEGARWIDDFVRKPFHPGELAGRLRELWRRRFGRDAGASIA